MNAPEDEGRLTMPRELPKTLASEVLSGNVASSRGSTDGVPRQEPNDQGEATQPLDERERHELVCLRHQVRQLAYPCSPHCEGYLREQALTNGADRINAGLIEALDDFMSYGCPACNGDCAAANPPISSCPVQGGLSALRQAANLARSEGA